MTADSLVPFVDLARQHGPLRERLLDGFARVLDGGAFIMGREVGDLEQRLSALCGVPHAISCASGTDALILALQATGVEPGTEVVTSPFSFIATAGAVCRLGATPVFADVDADTFNLSPESAEAAITPRTRALLPVHIFGEPADMQAFRACGQRHGLAVIEDACQALGATQDGRPAGALGDAAAFSFFPTKNLGALGDAGLVTTASAEIAGTIRSLRDHGSRPGDKYMYERVGTNSRLDTLQAAALLVKLDLLEEWNRARRAHAAFYREALADTPLRPQATRPGDVGTAHQFTVRAPDRDALRVALGSAGIGSAVYYPAPLHLQPAFRHLGYTEGQLPVAEALCHEVVSLPVFPELTEPERGRVVDAVRRFYGV